MEAFRREWANFQRVARFKHMQLRFAN